VGVTDVVSRRRAKGITRSLPNGRIVFPSNIIVEG
jgi:hypothetical protein